MHMLTEHAVSSTSNATKTLLATPPAD